MVRIVGKGAKRDKKGQFSNQFDSGTFRTDFQV